VPAGARRILLKLSGEMLMGQRGFGIDVDAVERLAGEIAAIHQSGTSVGLVVGGGNIFRGIAGAARGLDRAEADQIGMLATVMNSIALRNGLESAGAEAVVLSAIPMDAICEPYSRSRALQHLEAGRVAIFAAGTGSPFFTTDTAAVLRAAETRCEVVMKATKVDGVYSADPERDPKAQRYERLTYGEVLERDLGVMDAAAIALARDNAIPIIVFSIREAGALGEVVRGRGRFTLVAD
jgi:uridylate kinase